MALLKSINVPLGTKAIDFCLKGIDGEMHSLADYNDKDVLYPFQNGFRYLN